jgi:peroxiredoxin
MPGKDLPVQLYLARGGRSAWFKNGSEIVNVPEITGHAKSIKLHFPAFNNTVELVESAHGYSGRLTLVKRGYEQVLPLQAVPDPGYRFKRDLAASIDVTGRWAVEFTEDEGRVYQAVAEFDQQIGKLTGTFLTPLGDYRFLAGEVMGDKIYLSTFDGAHAFVFTGRMQNDRTLKGEFWSGTQWHESWVAEQDFDAKLEDPYSLTFLKEGYDKFDFEFPDLDGTPVSLDDSKYQDKVVLVTLGGTWCPNCADEMEFLSAYYEENRDRGLEIVTLLFEHSEDFDSAARQGRALVDKHDIQFDVLVAGSSDKARASKALPMLNRVIAFPTMIMIDNTGKVRHIHTGFSGPGTGQHFEDFKAEFNTSMDKLLAEG